MYQGDTKVKYISASGAAGLGRCRIKALWIVPGTLAGLVSAVDTGASPNPTLFRFDTIANGQVQQIEMQGEGVLSIGDPNFTLTNVTSVSVIYG